MCATYKTKTTWFSFLFLSLSWKTSKFLSFVLAYWRYRSLILSLCTCCHTGVLPLASLRLMASPLQLTYSYIWQVIRQKNVKLYGRVEEFVTMVTQTVPELMSFKQTAQLLLGLRARVRRSQTVQSADIGITNSTPTLCTFLWLLFWRIFLVLVTNNPSKNAWLLVFWYETNMTD